MNELRARVVAAPHDLDLRLVYGDALTAAGDPRGEAIVLAVELERAGLATIDALVDADLTDAELVHRAGQHRRLQQLGPALEDKGSARVYDPDEVAALAVKLREEPLLELSLGFSHELAPAALALPLAQIRRVELHASRDAVGVEALLERMPALERVVFRSVATTPQLAALAPTVTSVRLHDPDDRNLVALTGRRLRELDVGREWSGGGGSFEHPLVALDGRFASAERIGLSRRRITDDDLLAALPTATLPPRLDLGHNQLTSRSLLALAARSFVELDLENTRPSASVLAALLEHPRLTHLNLAVIELSAEMLEALERPARLERLALTGTITAGILAAHPLRQLRVHAAGANADAVARTLAPTSLRALDLGHAALTDAGAMALTELDQLRRLRIPQTLIGDRAIAAIAARMKRLVELDLEGTMIRRTEELRALPALVSLRAPSRDVRPASRELVLLLPAGSLRAAAARVGIAVDQFGTVELDGTRVQGFYGDARGASTAAALARTPERARAIEQLAKQVMYLVDRDKLDASRALLRKLAQAVDGVVWDIEDDALLD